MRESLETFGVFVKLTGGLGLLLIYPLLPFLIFYGGLMMVGRGIWSRGTETKPPKRDGIDAYLRHDYEV